MGKDLTKNARWIIFWAETISPDVPLAKPFACSHNIGRFSYDVPTRKAIEDVLDFSKDVVLRSMVYEVDVALYPYAKQWEEVNKLADRYFENQINGAKLAMEDSNHENR